MMETLGLIADIGGTNARFALAPIRSLDANGHLPLTEADLLAAKTLDGAAFATIEAAINEYLDQLPAQFQRPTKAVMAIACPVDQDEIRMTNHFWAFKVSELKTSIGFEALHFINDYNAMANAIPQLSDDELVKIGRGDKTPLMPIAVTGPGTGLGLAALAFSASGQPVTLETEGGHAHFAPTNLQQIEVLKVLMEKYDRVSYERLLSGSGLENIYSALTALQGDEKSLKAPEISTAALAKTDEICGQALSLFCEILGAYAGDIALALGAKGGLYITGGIIPRFIDYFHQSNFRIAFESKARFSDFNAQIPTFVVVADQPGLLGAAAVLNHKFMND